MNNKILLIAKIVSIIMLIWASRYNPYIYYQILRWIVCIVSGYTAFIEYKKNKVWMAIFALISILFNPIAPFYFNRETWRIIDIIIAVIILISIFVFKEYKIKEKIIKD